MRKVNLRLAKTFSARSYDGLRVCGSSVKVALAMVALLSPLAFRLLILLSRPLAWQESLGIACLSPDGTGFAACDYEIDGADQCSATALEDIDVDFYLHGRFLT